RGAERFFAGHYNVASWNWELPRCPPEWADAFRYFDEIWAPSRYTQAAIASVSPVPVRWVPYAVTVPATLPPGVSRATFGLPEYKFVCAFAFAFHGCLERKTPRGLVRAFRLAFEDRDDVLLGLKSMHAKDAPAELAALQEAIGDARNIHLLDTVFPRS